MCKDVSFYSLPKKLKIEIYRVRAYQFKDFPVFVRWHGWLVTFWAFDLPVRYEPLSL